MAPTLPQTLVRRSWWWVFGLCIALPAVVLAALGVSALRADDVAREQQQREREAQVAGLVDAAVASVLDDLSRDAGDDGVRFDLDGQGRLRFPDDRLSGSADDMGAPPEALPSISQEIARLVADARAADAQGRTAEALALYEQLRRHAALRPWTEMQALLSGASPGTSLARYVSEVNLANSDAVTPSGVPLALAVAALVDVVRAAERAALRPFLVATRASLFAGRWWLSPRQRRVYGAELDRWLIDAGWSPDGATDVRLEAVTNAEPWIRQAIEGGLVPRARAQVVRNGDRRTVILWEPPGKPAAAWHGVVVSYARVEAAFARTLEPLVRDQPLELTLQDEASRVWGAVPGPSAAVRRLEAVDGWSLALTDTTPLVPIQRRLLEYGRVVLPIVVLGFGLLMTVWLVRREMALTSQQSAFVAAVTHEFKSPITSIRLLLERVVSGRLATGDTPERYVAAIGAETDRLERLVNRLLEAQKLQRGQRDYRFEVTDVSGLARQAVTRFSQLAEARGITLGLSVSAGIPGVSVDVDSMSDAIANLVDNAIKYSPRDSSVDVSVERAGDQLRIIVADEGIGVLPVDAQRIFDPFVRSRRGDEANVHGTGLGLSLVKATAEAHGGSVSVESDGVRGSRFVLEIPMAGPRAEAAAVEPVAPVSGRGAPADARPTPLSGRS